MARFGLGERFLAVSLAASLWGCGASQPYLDKLPRSTPEAVGCQIVIVWLGGYAVQVTVVTTNLEPGQQVGSVQVSWGDGAKMIVPQAPQVAEPHQTSPIPHQYQSGVYEIGVSEVVNDTTSGQPQTFSPMCRATVHVPYPGQYP